MVCTISLMHHVFLISDSGTSFFKVNLHDTSMKQILDKKKKTFGKEHQLIQIMNEIYKYKTYKNKVSCCRIGYLDSIIAYTKNKSIVYVHLNNAFYSTRVLSVGPTKLLQTNEEKCRPMAQCKQCFAI